MLDKDTVSHYLTDFFAEHMPVADYLGMRVHSYTPERFELAIDLQPSLNDKMTAWGGSLYGLTVMNCWGMLYLQARERGINPNMVVRHGEIDYLAPVDDEVIISRCEKPVEGDWESFFDRVKEKGRATTALNSVVHSKGREAVRFSGRYTVIGLKQ